MKKIWFGIGAVIIIILLLLQTKFNIFLRLDYDGYATPEKSVKALLLSNPEELVEEDTVALYPFEPLEYIYSRGNSYYLGEEKKSAIDLSFPLLINGGSGIWFVDDSSTLFDIDYDEYSTYRALTVSDRLSYNPGGEQADGTEFLFASLRNGFFVNLDSVKFDDKGTEREISTNSFIYFTEEYFTYLEQEEDGTLRYQICRNTPANARVTVNDEDMTYHELLVRLHIISDKIDKNTPVDTPPVEEIVPTPEVLEIAPEEVSEDDSKEQAATPTATPEKAAKSASTKKSGGSSSGTNKQSASSKSLGVRPDSARADKKSDKNKKKKPLVLEYVKPTVEYKGITRGVYRIMPTVTVYDPANRISSTRRIQFEYYEITTDALGNEKETLVYRNTAPSPASKTPVDITVTAGDGNIKPNTRYKINIQFGYNNEYDEPITELVQSNIYITTLPIDPNAKVAIKTGTENGVTYNDIPIYYDQYVSIVNVTYDEVLTDEEALYGLDPHRVTIKIDGNGGTNKSFTYSTEIDSRAVTNFKTKDVTAIFETLPVLEPNSKYKYTITGEDYFKNNITITNNTGEFETCKARPNGTIELANNVIGHTNFDISITDNQASSIQPENGSTNFRDVYFVVSTKKNTVQTGETDLWADCKEYIENGKRLQDENGNATGPIHYMEKIDKYDDEHSVLNGYKIDPTTGAISLAKINIDTNSLDLGERYYVYLLADFDLNNKTGPVYHGVIGQMDFRSATLSSLGNIYIQVDVSHIKAHEAIIKYNINDSRTVDELQALLKTIEFQIVPANGNEPKMASHIVFDQNAVDLFTGYKGDYGVRKREDTSETPPTQYPIGSVTMDSKYFDGVGPEGATDTGSVDYTLTSKTDYKIVPVVKALYNGKEYDMKCVLTRSAFKTMKEPATVDVQSLIFAGGTLKFDVKIDDPDETIIGNSGHVVVMNLYNDRYDLIKAIRIEKNKGYIQEQFTNLDPSRKYHMDFIAVEYNEGYDNSTFESNKVIYTYDIRESLNITGSIKLQGLTELASGKMNALTKVTISDTDRIMTGASRPYYVRVEKKNTDTGKYEETDLSKSYSDYTPGLTIEQNGYYETEKNGDYKLTLYIMFNNNEVDLDTLYFTTEKPIVAIKDAWEFVTTLKKNEDKNIKYCITGDIDLDAYNANPSKDSNNKNISSNSIVSIFNGQIDFQGYTLKRNKTGDNTQIFNNIGPTGEIYNLVFEISDNTTSGRIWDEGGLASRNYGHIHDIIVEYKGGSGVNNQHYGLVCRINAATGIIERFVVHNDPAEGTSTFSARYEAGMICGINEGIIRNGYAYGKNINANVVTPNVGGALQIGTIAGRQTNLGQMYNVFSLVNVVVATPAKSSDGSTKEKEYGAVIGTGAGRIRNIYSVGQSKYSEAYNGSLFDKDVVGPAIGTNVNSSRNVFYWNADGFDYSSSTRQKRVGIESLYDYSWQGTLLGNVFDAQPVEVGFYPQVIMSEEVPAQEYIPLPGKENVQPVEIVASEVLEYGHNDERGDYAVIQFRLSNPRNALIKSFDIEDLTTEVLTDTAKNLDGYTTINAIVYNPKHYYSQYTINSLTVQMGSTTPSYTSNPKPILYVDFYRPVSNVDEWEKYVKNAPTENAKLTADIDFSGIDHAKYRVSSEYKGKLDGDNHTISGINIVSDSKSSHNYCPTLFGTVSGDISNLFVDGLTCDMGTRNKDRAGLIYTLSGTVNNVHLNNVNLRGWSHVGALAGYASEGSEIQDCSASNVVINYNEPRNTNTDGRVGGLIGYANQCHLRNCFVRNADISILDIKNLEGAGGLVGYSHYAGLENLYATGKVEARGINVGGIVGTHVASEVSNVMKNLIAKVDVTSYQNVVGGLVGNLNLSGALTETNNMSGISFGNVACKNSDSEDVSYTVGYITSYKGSFYGSDFQLINGMVGVEKDENTRGLITYAQATDSSNYSSILGMSEGYNYGKADSGYIPTLYYYGTNTEMPNQEEDIPIANVKKADDLVTVKEVTVDKVNNRITFKFLGPSGFKVNKVQVAENTLLFAKADGTDLPQGQMHYVTKDNFYYAEETLSETVSATYIVTYRAEGKQEHFFDSYNLLKVGYENADGSIVGESDFSKDPVRIPLVLYRNIPDIETWNAYINNSEQRNSGNYENYRLTPSAESNYTIDFSSVNWDRNAKIGRLVGNTSGSNKPIIKGVNINAGNENFIFRLNSEMADLRIQDCNLKVKDRACAGLIGSSAANIYNVDFSNITVNNSTANQFVGIIGYQIGGCFGREDVQEGAEIRPGKITLNNIKITNNLNSSTNKTYTGGLVGYAKTGTKFTNIEGSLIEVNGDGRVGGIAGGTGKAFFNTVSLRDIKVSSRANERVGGVVGSYEPGRTSGKNGAEFVKVSVTGTPTLGANDEIESSTTEISFDTSGGSSCNYIGGLVGWNGVYYNGRDGLSNTANTASGIVVRGLCDYTGGLYGYCYDSWYGSIDNSLITTVRDTQGKFNYVGGIAGACAYNYKYNDTRNTLINIKNHSYVGLSIGSKTTGTSNTYCKVENSKIKASETGSNDVQFIGGFAGNSEGETYYATVYNTTLDTSVDYVGGILGRTNNNIYRSFYFATPKASSSPEADSDLYFVKGYDNVGGVIGNHYSSKVETCYSNANVIAENYYAGGIDGRYRNNYILTVIDGANNYSYSSSSISYSYFAGSVKAGNYAGGMVGNVAIKTCVDITDTATKEDGGRRSAKDGDLLKTGSSNEVNYTFQNLIVASTIEATNGEDAYAFAGNVNGFEGKANSYNGSTESKYKFTEDKSTTDRANRTYLWDGTLVKTKSNSTGTRLAEMTNDNVPAKAKNTYNGNTYRYIRYANNSKGLYNDSADKNDCDIRASMNVRLVSSDDLKTHGPYYSLNWSNETTTSATRSWQGLTDRVIMTNDVNVSTAPFDDYIRSASYLPLIRVKDSGKASDYMTDYQTSNGMVLPVPSGYSTIRALRLAARRGNYTIERPNIYASDVDKINIEFSDKAYGGYFYFKLYYGDELVSKKIIEQRVYSFEYDFVKPIRVEYGYVDTFGYTWDMSDMGYTSPGVDYELEDCLDDATYCSPMLNDKDEEDILVFKPIDLSHKVMTYGKKYYYVSNDGVVSGLGNMNDEGEDTTAELLRGDFRTIYNGLGLLKNGEVVDIDNGGRVLRKVEGLKELENPVPLEQFVLNGSEIKTYWKYSDIVSTGIDREAQVIKSKNNDVVILAGSVPTVKDSIVLYTKNASEFVTVLGEDKIMTDLYHGDNINAPEDFKPSNIVYMSNNFNTSAPFIVVQYATGGVVGYNYMTGEYLFNHFVLNDMKPLEYLAVYLDDDISMLADSPATYAAVAKIAAITGTSNRLLAFVEDNNLGDLVENNSDPDALTAEPSGSEKYVAGENTAKTGDNTEVRDESSNTVKNSTASYNETGTPQGSLEKSDKSNVVAEPNTGGNGGDSEALGQGDGQGGSKNNNGATGGKADNLDLETNVAGSGKSSPAGTYTMSGDSTANGLGGATGEKADNGNGEGGADKPELNELDDPNLDDQEDNQDSSATDKLYPETKDNLKNVPEKAASEPKDEPDSNTERDGKIADEIVDGEGKGSSTGTGISVPVSKTYEESSANESTEDEEKTETVSVKKELSMVYNQSTGTYELIDLDKFLNEPSYVSENARLGIKDFSAYGGYATEVKQDTDEKQKKGLILYIIAALALLGGIGGGIYYKKKHNVKI